MKKECYFISLIFKPRETMAKLEKDPHKIFKSFRCMLIMSLLYGLASFCISLNNIPSSLKPCLNLPEDRYYFYQSFFICPVIISGWLLMSGFGFLLSKALKGNGDFENILVFTGYCIAVPTYITLLADLITSLTQYSKLVDARWWADQISTFGTWPFYFLWTIMLAEVVLIILYLSIAFIKTQNFTKVKSTIIALITFIIYQFFLLLFIR